MGLFAALGGILGGGSAAGGGLAAAGAGAAGATAGMSAAQVAAIEAARQAALKQAAVQAAQQGSRAMPQLAGAPQMAGQAPRAGLMQVQAQSAVNGARPQAQQMNLTQVDSNLRKFFTGPNANASPEQRDATIDRNTAIEDRLNQIGGSLGGPDVGSMMQLNSPYSGGRPGANENYGAIALMNLMQSISGGGRRR